MQQVLQTLLKTKLIACDQEDAESLATLPSDVVVTLSSDYKKWADDADDRW